MSFACLDLVFNCCFISYWTFFFFVVAESYNFLVVYLLWSRELIQVQGKTSISKRIGSYFDFEELMYLKLIRERTISVLISTGQLVFIKKFHQLRVVSCRTPYLLQLI